MKIYKYLLPVLFLYNRIKTSYKIYFNTHFVIFIHLYLFCIAEKYFSSS